MGPPWRIDPTTHRTMSERSYHGATSRSHYATHAVKGVALIFVVCSLLGARLGNIGFKPRHQLPRRAISSTFNVRYATTKMS